MALLTTDQAAAHLNIPKKTMEQWRCKGFGPAFIRYTARCVRYSTEALDAWVQSCIRNSTSDPGTTAA